MVKVYDNILSYDICQSLIELFHTNLQHQQFFDDNCLCFTLLNVNKVSHDTVSLLGPCVAKLYKRYKKDIKNKYIPPFRLLEDFKIKEYDTSGNQKFDEHVDVINSHTSTRALGFLFYLNDNDGYTKFQNGQVVESKANRAVIFDSPELHTGSTPTDAYGRYVVNLNWVEHDSPQIPLENTTK